jgi:fido (protein-threonine AMPylation protein)
MRHGWPTGLLFADVGNRRSLARAASHGTLRRIIAGVYTADVQSPLEDVTRRYLYQILEHERPGIVITDACARTGQPVGGLLLACSARQQRDLDLPGVIVRLRTGPGPQPDDMVLAAGVWLAGPVRGLLDNLSLARGAASRRLSRSDIELWLEELLDNRGEDYLNRLRQQARTQAAALGRAREVDILDRLIGTLLGTRTDTALTHRQDIARVAGAPVDAVRLRLFEQLASWLADQPPNLALEQPELAERRLLLPFYEAYFSNFIEGTEFTLDEAARIALDGRLSVDRPQDAHDVSGTYEIVADRQEMRRRPANPTELEHLLQTRHRRLLGGRPEMKPGAYKTNDNLAGSTVFVAWPKVSGTLTAGLDPYLSISDPFARAVYMMFFISEVHPFRDGNGRIARIMMNAELVAADQVRIVIPTVYRENYLAALRAATRTQHFDALYRMLDFARRFTARVDFSSRASAEADLARTNALLDAVEAERNGLRLQLP